MENNQDRQTLRDLEYKFNTLITIFNRCFNRNFYDMENNYTSNNTMFTLGSSSCVSIIPSNPIYFESNEEFVLYKEIKSIEKQISEFKLKTKKEEKLQLLIDFIKQNDIRLENIKDYAEAIGWRFDKEESDYEN